MKPSITFLALVWLACGFAHAAGPKPNIIVILADDDHPEIVAKLLQRARAFDEGFQKRIPDVRYLVGPEPPAPGQVCTSSDNMDNWLKLTP